jgi:hypothetical protein
MGIKRRDIRGSDEVIIRRDVLDPATCRELGGAFDEDGKCVLRKRVDPHDPDSLILKRVNYSKSDTSGKNRDDY